MIGLALSGGGSRAIAFHLGCLRALEDLKILKKVGVLSTISGGSLIGAYYAYTPDKSFEEFETDVRKFLKDGFHRKIIFEFLRPLNLLLHSTNFIISKTYKIVGSFDKKLPTSLKPYSMTEAFRNVLYKELFFALTMCSPRRYDIEIVIGACELRTGTAFRFGTLKTGCWRHGEVVDNSIDVALGVAASAAYPIFLPAIDRTWKFRKKEEEREQRVLLTDGGVYDNLGVQVIEPQRDPEISLHTFPCDYIIACNAGHGQEGGHGLQTTLMGRVARSFEIVHRRVQDSTMRRLHNLKEARLIKGFALPYLGQQDDRLPWNPNLVPREEVIAYPTDFAPMPDYWINRLSERGEQLTRLLTTYYLSDLL